ncbi:AT-rich interactive domain-containing protein 2 [Platanthera guangdongensis]|uniref:AT-rich interactive domain-containing protein 2 n=1 Tax=Platanthera guangdongensis TaxID=2320717 RepID=A0ABR2M252_9ASPA
MKAEAAVGDCKRWFIGKIAQERMRATVKNGMNAYLRDERRRGRREIGRESMKSGICGWQRRFAERSGDEVRDLWLAATVRDLRLAAALPGLRCEFKFFHSSSSQRCIKQQVNEYIGFLHDTKIQFAYSIVLVFLIEDVKKEHFEADTSLVLGRTHASSVLSDMEFKSRPSDIMPSARGFRALENGKRPSSVFCPETMNKRAKQENEAITITAEEKYSLEESAWKIPAATDEYILQKAGLDQLEDLRSPLSEHSHRRPVPIGSDHQADLPEWTPRNFRSPGLQSSLCDAYSAPSFSASSPPMDARRFSTECDCPDEGSIGCVRQHVMEAREMLRSALREKFVELGFLDMGEDVAERWTEMEENLFHAVVSSNSTSSGRNFWTVLPHAFPLRGFRELVSYYFNVFVLRKRADQNHFYPSNVDSDNDDSEENCYGDFAVSEEGEDELDSGVESATDDENIRAIEDDASEELDFEDEVDDEEEDEGFYSGKPIPCGEQIERNSTDCSQDQDVQDDSCTSFERLCNTRRGQEYQRLEHRDYEFLDDDCDSKPWEISYIGGAEKDFDFFPTCNVLEEVFGKGPWDNDKRDGRDFG